MSTETKEDTLNAIKNSPLATEGRLIEGLVATYTEKKEESDRAEAARLEALDEVRQAVDMYNAARLSLFKRLWKESGLGWCTYYGTGYEGAHSSDPTSHAVPAEELKPFYIAREEKRGSHYTEHWVDCFEIHWLCEACQEAYGKGMYAVEEGLTGLGYFNEDGAWTPLPEETQDLKEEVPNLTNALASKWGIPPKLHIPYEGDRIKGVHPEHIFESSS